MVPIALFDNLDVTVMDGGNIQFDCQWVEAAPQAALIPNHTELPPAQENLAYRAFELFRNAVGERRGARIRVRKRIPAAAGLGGASSDAAAVLLAANDAFQTNMNRQELAELASQLGSDVPFFLHPGAALCEGRGEQITPLGDAGMHHWVLVCPPQGCSTKEVYGRLGAKQIDGNDTPTASRENALALFHSLRLGDFRHVARQMHNDLQPVAAQINPWIKKISDAFGREQVVAHQLTGSGSCYFALCHSGLQAKRVARRLAGRGLGQFFCVPSFSPPGGKASPGDQKPCNGRYGGGTTTE